MKKANELHEVKGNLKRNYFRELGLLLSGRDLAEYMQDSRLDSISSLGNNKEKDIKHNPSLKLDYAAITLIKELMHS